MAFSPHNHEFTDALLAALGLKDRRILKLSVHLAVEELVTVDVTELAECCDTGKLVELSGKYQLTEREAVAEIPGDEP